MAIHLLSLGAGVQSSTMALMAAAGEITPMPTAAIFADTQAEPASVYKWLDWLEKQLPFPVYRVTRGSLENDSLKIRTTKDGRTYTKTLIPFFTRDVDGEIGITKRACTSEYKIRQLVKHARAVVGRTSLTAWRGKHRDALTALRHSERSEDVPFPGDAWRECQNDALVVQWIGISVDERQRVKESRDPWIKCRWPLIEKYAFRHHCLEWMASHGFPEPPRSACRFCPLHGNGEWARLKRDEPAEFLSSVEFERAIQAGKAVSNNFRSVPYLHKSCRPLDEIDFSDLPDDGGFWHEECEGMCGV